MTQWRVGVVLPGKQGQSFGEVPARALLSLSLLTTGQQWSEDQPARTSQQVDQSRLTPTALEVSRGAHVLEIVHVDDVDNGGYDPGPVL